MIIQIYEIQTPEEARAMIDLGVDHVGSVLTSEQHWRNAALKSTVDLVRRAGAKSSIIPLFHEVDTIANAVDYYEPDIVHFCETLSAEPTQRKALEEVRRRQGAIRQRYPNLEIMRSIPIGRTGCGSVVDSLDLAERFESISDWFLTDTLLSRTDEPGDGEQPVEGYVGITGKTCDWQVAGRLVRQSRIPVILAGGIGPDNVSDGILQVRPAGVDSCTLTNALDPEGRPLRFCKDTDKVRCMVQNARNGTRA